MRRVAHCTAARARVLSAAARVGIIALAGAFAAGCSELTTATPPPPATQPGLSAASSGPHYGPLHQVSKDLARQGIRSFNQYPDSTLWRFIEASDSIATVGIKSPQAARGFSNRGKWLVSQSDWQAGQMAVRAVPGATVTRVDTLVPWVMVKVQGVATLTLLRRLPHVEYVEPALMVDMRLLDNQGCGEPLYSGPSTRTASGDTLSGPFQWMRVDRAWHFSPGGRGVLIGLSDTGINLGQPELNERFAEGQSAGRQITLTNQVDATCSHGTRSAGVIAAPMNGRNIVGIAWAADLFSYKHGNDVLVWGEGAAYEAVRWPAYANGRISDIVSMAWGTAVEYGSVRNEILLWHYNHNVLFIASSGAEGVTLYPSSIPEVLSVNAANYDGTAPSSAAEPTDIIAYHNLAATAMGWEGPDRIVNLGQASAGTAAVAGIAALVIQLYPEASNTNIAQWLVSTAGAACGMPPTWGPALINAEAAVGGVCWNKSISGPNFISWDSWDTEPYKDVAYSVTVSGGYGPIEITWSNGSVGPTAIYRWWRGNWIGHVSVTVRDAGIPFPGYSNTMQVEGRDWSNPPECPPPQITCN
jgi:hypothetical protein